MIAILVSPLIKLVTVASPDYLKEHGIPETPQELSGRNCLRLWRKNSGAFSVWEFSNVVGGSKKFKIEVSGKYISNDDESMIRMAPNGTGIIQHLDFTIAEHIDVGKLQLILKGWAVSFPGSYTYVSSRVRMPSKVHAFTDSMVGKRVKIES